MKIVFTSLQIFRMSEELRVFKKQRKTAPLYTQLGSVQAVRPIGGVEV